VSALCPACEVDSTVAEEEAQAELTSALHILWTGGPEQKRVTIEEAEDWADVLSTADPEAKDARSALGWLRTIVHTEKDDWIASRLLKNLLPLSCELLNPLYRDALTDPSPNVRWRAIQWFQSQKDSEALPLLENLWASEERPWVVPDLIEALAFNTSTRYRDDILGLARGEDVPLARAALRAFEILHDDALIPDLDEISRSGNRLVRQAALNALATWPESQDALEAVLRATRGTDRETLLSAIPLLKNFSSPDAVHHLMELSAHHADSQAREHALRALESTRPDGFVELLVGILREAPSEAVSSLQSEAISALHDLDDPDVLPMLSGVDPRVGGAGLYSFTELIDNLSRDRNASPRGVQSISVSCGRSSFRNSDGDEQSVPLVEPPEGLQTIRCWEFPFVPGDPEDFPRIPAGTEVWIQDHFERGGESWVQVPGDFEECWVRRNELEPAVSQASKGSRTPVDRFRVEIDISFEEFESAPTRALRDAGLLKVIEPGDLVVGVVLSLHPDEPKTIPQLLDSYRDDNSLLDDAVLELLNALSKALPDRPDLIDFFRKHPGAKNAIEGPSSDESGGEKEEFQLIDP
jgi:HEAT repeat protein